MKTLLCILLLTAATPIRAQTLEMDSFRYDGTLRLMTLGDLVIYSHEFMMATPIDPHFKATPDGWVPSCPTGTTLVRHDPPPDCIWGTTPMDRKPTMGDMECVDTAKVKSLPACVVAQ